MKTLAEVRTRGFAIEDGEVRGNGTIGSNLTVRSGVVRAVDITTSNTPGTLSIRGDFALGSTTTVKAYLAGTTAGSSTGYGRVVSDSAVTLDGALKVETVGGFAPSSGQSFDIV